MKNLSQEIVANHFNIARTTWAGYESGKYQPNASLLKRICDFFNVKVDDIFLDNIEGIFTSKSITLKNEKFKVLAITVDSNQKQNIEFVPIKAAAGYALNFYDPVFIRDLPRFSIPKLNEGTYRAFEIKGISMKPVNEGDIIVGRYIENIKDIRYKKRHIIILKGEDVLFKRVFNDISDANKLIMLSDNPDFIPYSIHLEDIAEIWEMVLCIRYGDEIDMYDEFFLQKLNQIEQKLNQVIDSKR